jgi:hypothetical protein
LAPPAQTTTARVSYQLPRQGFFLLAPLALFWGTNWLAMKLAVLDMDPWTFQGICFIMGAGGALAAIAAAAGLTAHRRPEDLAFHRLRRIQTGRCSPAPKGPAKCQA